MRKNRYSRKQQHKRELKRRHAKFFHRNQCPQSDKERCEREYFDDLYDPDLTMWLRRRIDHRNSGYRYWETLYLSGPRQYAKDCTNRRIRRRFNKEMMDYEDEDVPALQNSDYRKEYDYDHTIW